MSLRRFRLSLLARVGLFSLVAILRLGLMLARDLGQNIRREAINDARTVATLTANLQIQPLLRPSDLTGKGGRSAPSARGGSP